MNQDTSGSSAGMPGEADQRPGDRHPGGSGPDDGHPGGLRPGDKNKRAGSGSGGAAGRIISLTVCFLCLVFIAVSALTGFETGIRMGKNLGSFLLTMVKILPGAFILIGLFDVWVPRHIVERHLGEASGLMGHLWMILLAGTSVGGLYVAFPMACALQKKGAALPVIFTYLGASGICRLPMTLFEISFMGAEFTIVRYLVSLPLLVLSSHVMGTILQKRGFELTAP